MKSLLLSPRGSAHPASTSRAALASEQRGTEDAQQIPKLPHARELGIRLSAILFPVLWRSPNARVRHRRAIGETVIVIWVGAISALVLWRLPHEWPFIALLVVIWLLGLFASGYLVGAHNTFGVLATGVITLAALLAAFNTSPLRGAVSNSVTVRGTVTCLSHANVVGAWVHSLTGQGGWASWAATPSKESVAKYSFALTHPEKYRLGVGCGGTPQAWRVDLVTPYVNPGRRSFVCNDTGQTGRVFNRCRVVK